VKKIIGKGNRQNVRQHGMWSAYCGYHNFVRTLSLFGGGIRKIAITDGPEGLNAREELERENPLPEITEKLAAA